MSATWMGRYEELIRELVRHTNIVLKGSQIKRDLAGRRGSVRKHLCERIGVV